MVVDVARADSLSSQPTPCEPCLLLTSKGTTLSQDQAVTIRGAAHERVHGRPLGGADLRLREGQNRGLAAGALADRCCDWLSCV